MTSNREIVDRALGLLLQGLYPYIEQKMRSVYGDGWIEKATPSKPKNLGLKRPFAEILQQDVSVLLKVMKWQPVFKTTLGEAERALVSELLDTRNKFAHDFTFPSDNDDTYRVLDSIERLLRAIGDLEKAGIVKKDKQKISGSERKLRIIRIPPTYEKERKTTLVVNLAYELAKKGKKVLVVDLDYSAKTSLLLGVNKAYEYADNSIYPSSFNDYLKNKGSLDIIQRSSITGYYDWIDFIDKSVSSQYDFLIIDESFYSWESSSRLFSSLSAVPYFLIPFQRKHLRVLRLFNPQITRKSRLIQEDTHPSRGNVLCLVPMSKYGDFANLLFNLYTYICYFMICTGLWEDAELSTHIRMALSSGQPVSVYSQQNHQVPNEIGNTFSEIAEELLIKIEFFENNSL
jgi:hypothetical protein